MFRVKAVVRCFIFEICWHGVFNKVTRLQELWYKRLGVGTRDVCRGCFWSEGILTFLGIWKYFSLPALKVSFKNRNCILSKSCSFYSELAVNLVNKAQVSVQKVNFLFRSWRLNPASYRSQDIKYLNYSSSKLNWDLCCSSCTLFEKTYGFEANCCREWSFKTWYSDYFVAPYDGLSFWHIQRTFA